MNIKIKNLLSLAIKEYPFLFVIIYFYGNFYTPVMLIYTTLEIFLSFVFLVFYYVVARLVIYRIFKDKELVLCLLLWFSLSYEFLYLNIFNPIPMLKDRPLFSVIFFVPLLAGIIWLLKFINDGIKQRLILWVKLLLVLALVYPLTLNIYWLFEKHKYTQEQVTPKISTQLLEEKKNIYLFVFDAYTGNAGLKKYWHFNNDEVTELLKKNGFFVSDNARTYVDNTLESMNATFNFTKSKQPVPVYLEKFNNISLLRGINSSILLKLLEKNDYTLENNSLLKIDYKLFRIFSLFGKSFLFEGSIFNPFIQKIFGVRGYLLYNDAIQKYNQRLFKILGEIKNSSLRKGEFKYFHFFLPHPPYLYDKNGNVTLKETDYLSQVQYSNILIKSIIGKLLPSKNNIIIIMGDHGSREVGNPEVKLDNYNPFFAIHLPDGNYSQFSDSFIVNKVFSTILRPK